MLLLACGLGNGAVLTHNKQVCTLMSVRSHRPVLGEHFVPNHLNFMLHFLTFMRFHILQHKQ